MVAVPKGSLLNTSQESNQPSDEFLRFCDRRFLAAGVNLVELSELQFRAVGDLAAARKYRLPTYVRRLPGTLVSGVNALGHGGSARSSRTITLTIESVLLACELCASVGGVLSGLARSTTYRDSIRSSAIMIICNLNRPHHMALGRPIVELLS